MHRSAEFLELDDQRLYQRAGASHRVMDAPCLFDEMDHRIDGGHLKRIAADQERLKAEYLPHLVALEIFADQRKQGLYCTQLQQIGHDRQHRAEEPTLEDRARGFVESVVALQVFGREAGNLGANIGRIGVIIEEFTVIEIDAVEGQDRYDLEIAARFGPTADARNNALSLLEDVSRKIRLGQHCHVTLQQKQLFDEMRDRKDGRPHIKGETVRAKDIGAAANIVELFDDPCFEAKALQADRASYAANAGADYDCCSTCHEVGIFSFLKLCGDQPLFEPVRQQQAGLNC